MSHFIERLARHHDRAGFSCGEDVLDAWFKEVAEQAEARHGSARVFVLVDDGTDNGRSPHGFYALSSHSIRFEDVPTDVRRGQSRYVPIPCVLLGQLAVDVRYQKQGLGEALLADAVREIVAADEHVAMPLIVVDALNESIARWYAKYEFKPFPAKPLRLAIRVADARLVF